MFGKATNFVISGKTISRLAAVQTVFLYNCDRESGSIAQSADAISEYYSRPGVIEDFAGNKVRLHSAYFSLLKELLETKLNIVEQKVSILLHGYTDPLNLAILEVGGCELLYANSAPPKVVMSEFGNISAAFGLNPAVVNSVLEKLLRQDGLES